MATAQKMQMKHATLANIAGYARISNDDDLSSKNVSVETQKELIQSYVSHHFPDAEISLYDDRDISGYEFETRPGYQQMRRNLGKFHNILIVNDLSRFSRRNGKGLVELENLRDMGVRIISLAENIDYPAKDDWMQIQIYFFVNEMPVTQTSNKVRRVIQHRQEKGEWICATPYGYKLITEAGQKKFVVDPSTATIVQMAFRLYIDGWGYNKIAQYFSSQNLPTSTQIDKQRVESEGNVYHGRVAQHWSLSTIQKMLQNDFYIGTFRTRKFSRKKINGSDKKNDADEHYVFEHHHDPIIDNRTFALACHERQYRDNGGYRGQKKYKNQYSGLIFCGDCGAPMFAMSRSDLRPAYTCGSYHRKGKAGCTSHHTRMDILDTILKEYLRKLRNNCNGILAQLKTAIEQDNISIDQAATSIESLEKRLEKAKEDLKNTQRAKIRAIAKNPEQEELYEETYAELEQEQINLIEGCQKQIDLLNDSVNTMIRTNRVSSTVLDVFDSIITKESLDKKDIVILVKRITVFQDHIDIQLHADIDSLLCVSAQEESGNFKSGSIDSSPRTLIISQSAVHRADKVYTVNVIPSGSPSRMRMVRRISFGMTTRPRSSMRRTIPVAFISQIPPAVVFFWLTSHIIRNFSPSMQNSGWISFPTAQHTFYSFC